MDKQEVGMSKRKLQPNKPQKYREAWNYTLGVESAKRTISSSMRRRFWLKGFGIGMLVGVLITCAVGWVL